MCEYKAIFEGVMICRLQTLSGQCMSVKKSETKPQTLIPQRSDTSQDRISHPESVLCGSQVALHPRDKIGTSLRAVGCLRPLAQTQLDTCGPFESPSFSSPSSLSWSPSPRDSRKLADKIGTSSPLCSRILRPLTLYFFRTSFFSAKVSFDFSMWRNVSEHFGNTLSTILT